MKLKIILPIIASFSLLAASCNSSTTTSQDNSNPQPSTAYNTTPSASPTPTAMTSLTIPMTATKNSGQTGTAQLTDNGDGTTLVVLNITGEPKGADEPAHIHTGQCPDVGGVAFPLSDVKNGVSTSTVSSTLASLLSKLPLAINTHKSPKDIPVYESCGDITASGSGQ